MFRSSHLISLRSKDPFQRDFGGAGHFLVRVEICAACCCEINGYSVSIGGGLSGCFSLGPLFLESREVLGIFIRMLRRYSISAQGHQRLFGGGGGFVLS